MFRARSLTLALTASAALVVLTGCSNAAESPAPGAPAEESQAASSGDFCGDYAAAGGTLATPSNFQVGLPADQTISELSGRVAILDAATPPDEIATQWQTLHDLYAETITIAEQVPADEPVLDPRVFEIVKEISDPGKQIRDYLDAEMLRRAVMANTRSARSTLAALAATGVLALALAGCAGGETPATPEAASSASGASESASAEHLSPDELTALFDTLQFPPGEYDTSAELLSSIYPGLTVSDPSCLAPFGAGWEPAAASADDAVEMATSNDRSMTAVVVSSADAERARALFADAEEALATCADGSQSFELSGVPVDLQLETITTTVTGADEAVSWSATGEVSGASFSLVGITAVRGGTAIALVGWDPATNQDYVPAATQMFIDGF